MRSGNHSLSFQLLLRHFLRTAVLGYRIMFFKLCSWLVTSARVHNKRWFMIRLTALSFALAFIWCISLASRISPNCQISSFCRKSVPLCGTDAILLFLNFSCNWDFVRTRRIPQKNSKFWRKVILKKNILKSSHSVLCLISLFTNK